jgi:hypothetical protein
MLVVWSLEDNQWGGCRLDPKRSKLDIFQIIFAHGIILGRVSRYAATPVIVALSPGHIDITRFLPWSPIATGNHLDRAKRKKFLKLLDDWHLWRIWYAFRHFGTHFAESFNVSKSLWMLDPKRSREMPRCSGFDLAELRPVVFQDYLVNLRGGHCFGLSRTRRIAGGKITTFKRVHPVFDGVLRWYCREQLRVSAGSRSRTLYSRGVPKYKPEWFGSVSPELRPGVVGDE